jgi:hypothetical protein
MLALYGLLGFKIERHETFPLFGCYFAVFIIYLFVVFRADEERVAFWFYASFVIRSLLLFAIPNLSDDFYRFIWDGRLLASGYHPFAEVPSYYLEHHLSIPGINTELFQKLNSPDYFTIYPPVSQFIFWMSVKISPHSIYGSMFVMKLVILLSEIGSLLIINRLLAHYKLPSSRVLLYALNPLVILELTGNVHLEAVMIFFLLLGILFLAQDKWILSVISISLAIGVKLIPLIFLPALLPRLGWKRAVVYYILVGAVTALLFLPLLDETIVAGFQTSVGYYFKKFEFNASIYYLVKQLGFWFVGYNIIQTAGWLLGAVSASIIIYISLANFRRNAGMTGNRRLNIVFLFVILSYSLFTTTLHPWYITTLFALSIFTELRFALLWTAMIFLTYAGYSIHGFEENLWLVAIEYLAVFGYLAYELLWKRKESFLPA